jgi:hypothetical protein
VIALVAQGLAFAPEDTAAGQLAKLEVGLRTLASAETVTLLADFLGLPPPTRLQLSPELQRRKTIDLLAQWTLSLSAAQPLVVFVEDLHWCDVSTLELLGAEELVGLCERLGFPAYLGLGRVLRGWARVESGEGEAGLAEIQQAMVELTRIGSDLKDAKALLEVLA